MRSKIFFLTLLFIFFLAFVTRPLQAQVSQEKKDIYMIIKDTNGEKVEGYLRLYPEDLTVSTKDKEEKSIPLKLIESIKLEKVKEGIPGVEEMRGESYYSVKMQNSQEIFTLRKKYTFSLNTSVGVVTKTIDPDMVQGLFRKDSSPAMKLQNEQPFIRDKGVVLSLELKF
jgi:hypothetical protein